MEWEGGAVVDGGGCLAFKGVHLLCEGAISGIVFDGGVDLDVESVLLLPYLSKTTPGVSAGLSQLRPSAVAMIAHHGGSIIGESARHMLLNAGRQTTKSVSPRCIDLDPTESTPNLKYLICMSVCSCLLPPPPLSLGAAVQ